MPAASESAAQPLIKGGAIRDLLLFYEERYGRDYAGAVAKRLDGELSGGIWPERAALSILPNLWYPSRVAHHIMDGIAEVRTEAEIEELIRDGSDFVVRRLSKGIYQFLFRMLASPELYAKHIQRAWDQLHSSGRRRVVLTEPGLAESTITDWAGHHPMLCRTVNQTTRAVFVAMGCTDVELVQESCVATGGGWCKNLILYREA